MKAGALTTGKAPSPQALPIGYIKSLGNKGLVLFFVLWETRKKNYLFSASLGFGLTDRAVSHIGFLAVGFM